MYIIAYIWYYLAYIWYYLAKTLIKLIHVYKIVSLLFLLCPHCKVNSVMSIILFFVLHILFYFSRIMVILQAMLGMLCLYSFNISSLVVHRFTNDQVVLGFSKGFMIIVSRKKEEMGRVRQCTIMYEGQIIFEGFQISQTNQNN